MSLFHLFSPSNSLILVYDHLTQETAEQFELEVLEVRKYYKPVRLSELVAKQNKKRADGLFTVAFKEARKSVFIHGVPRLQGYGIPFTLFVRADCIGMNRLPPEEELDLYSTSYESSFKKPDLEKWKTLIWKKPDEVNAFLMDCRKQFGPLLLDKFDPTRFMTTWGKIKEISPKEMEVGVFISADPTQTSFFEDLRFIETQMGNRPKSAYCSHPVKEIDKTGFDCLVTSRRGMVEKKTGVFDLPQWEVI